MLARSSSGEKEGKGGGGDTIEVGQFGNVASRDHLDSVTYPPLMYKLQLT